MRDSLRQSMALSLLMLVALSGPVRSSAYRKTSASAPQVTLPRSPSGVYAKANIETLKTQFAGAKDLRKRLRTFYEELLSNPAISGLAIGAHWDHLQPGPNYPDGYDFDYLDDVFEVANNHNKSVQLIITPGFVSPPWLVNEIPSCDGLFHSIELVPPNCGKATFAGFPEEQRDDGNTELPLPWNPVYQQAWADFLGHLNDKYSSNPAFVAIAVAGPIGASDEMILPTSDNVTPGTVQPSGLSVDDTWEALIQHSFPVGGAITYPPKSDQVFIDAWMKAIDTYETIFSGITLVLSPDSGKDLPEFGVNRAHVSPHPDNGLLYSQDCSRSPSPLSCEAKTEVIQYFMNAICNTSENCVNGKATQVGGLTAQISDAYGNIGIGGVKLLTSWSPPLVPAFLGGAEFDHAVSGHQKLRTGCPTYPDKKPCKDLSVEEAAYNVLAVFFNNTPAGSYFKGTMPAISATGNAGGTPLHYLEVPEADVHYANTHQCLSDPSPVLGYMTLQQMLENVKRDFAGIADGTLPTTDTTPPVTTPILPSPTGLNGWYSGPTVLNFSALDDLSGVFGTEVSRDNQTTWKPLACDGIPLNNDGVHTVFYSSTDLAGGMETPKSITVKIDSTAPVTTAHYVVLDQQVTFAATDNVSGVARTEYKLDGSPWIKGTSLVFNSGGLHTIQFRSIDVAGNVEKTNSITLNVKLKSPPSQMR